MNIISKINLVRNNLDLEKAISGEKRVIALIYATWCPYCVSFLPVFKKYAQGRDGFLLIEDDQWVIADEYDVEVVPTALCFENGKLVKRLDGILGVGLNEKQLDEFIRACAIVSQSC